MTNPESKRAASQQDGQKDCKNDHHQQRDHEREAGQHNERNDNDTDSERQ